jgi:UDP-N-acetylmuramate dehydrogenase
MTSGSAVGTLSGLTTMRVGGPPAELIDATDRDALVEAALEVWGSGSEWLVVGGGSNLLVGDDGFPGTVLRVLSRGIEELPPPRPGTVRLRVQAGEPWDALVAETVARGLAGMEALSGIPGSCGAAPMQNIGAYGQELAETLVAIEFLDYLSGEVERLPAEALDLGYRTSALKRGRRGIVLAIEVDLENAQGLSRPIAYAQLASALGAQAGDRVPVQRVREAVLALRASKGMVLDPDDRDTFSAGSFFTNPIVTESFALRLPSEAPRWPVGPDAEARVMPLGEQPAAPAPTEPAKVKLSAAWLIEQSGIGRGFRLPGSRAAISSKHTLALTNTGDATAEEIAELARYVRANVLGRFGVALQPEPVLVGVEL